jgi:hypothetical protein
MTPGPCLTPVVYILVMRLVRLVVVVSLVSLYACGSPRPPVPQLRVINAGTEAIEDLTIIFPDSEVEFGDLPVGAATAYQAVPRGVYGYAAYRFKRDRVPVTQRVRDFVGAAPMGRARFSYRLELDSSQMPRGAIRLVEVTNDDR